MNKKKVFREFTVFIFPSSFATGAIMNRSIPSSLRLTPAIAAVMVLCLQFLPVGLRGDLDTGVAIMGTVAETQADSSILPHGADEKEDGCDLSIAEGMHLYWGEEPVENQTRTRDTVCLNGWWGFRPVVETGEDDVRKLRASPPMQGWGWMRIPGNYGPDTWPATPRTEIVPGLAAVWKRFDNGKVNLAWFRRRIVVPETWAGRAILVDLRRVATDAKVFIDGREAGLVDWPYGEVDVTRLVRPGQEHDIDILVASVPGKGIVERHVETADDRVSEAAADLHSRGLIGDVLLKSRPMGVYISDVFVQPSVRKKKVELDIELTGVNHFGGISVRIEMLDEDGKIERSFTTDAVIEAAESQTIKIVFPWSRPRLWDFGRPNLYTARVKVSGQQILDIYAQRFGFREFWVEGRNFYLNGMPFRMRPCLGDEPLTIDQMDAEIDRWIARGFNIKELWPTDHDRRGYYLGREWLAERADLKGMPLTGVVPSLNRYVEQWHDPEQRERWERRMLADMKRYRNHPSIMIWACSAHCFGNNHDQEPRYLGRRGWYDNQADWRQRADAGEAAIAIVRKHDPTRPVFTHQGAYVGDVYTCSMYLNMTPVQEVEEWLSAWAEGATMPFSPVEFEMPIHRTMRRGRESRQGADISEPLVTEWCAQRLGREAYELEGKDYRDGIRSAYDPANNRWRFRQPNIHAQPAFQELLRENTARILRSWRTMGTTGGILPWNDGHAYERKPTFKKLTATDPFEPGRRGPYFPLVRRGHLDRSPDGETLELPAGTSLHRNNAATLGWIAGPGADFPAKDHNFGAGETVRKQIVLINDTRVRQRWQASWEIIVDGRVIAAGEKQGKIDVAENLFRPIRFRLPGAGRLAGKRKVDGEICLTASIGANRHSDIFHFRVFADAGDVGESVTLFDPADTSRGLLTGLGCRVSKWDGIRPPPENKLLLVGQNALTALTSVEAEKLGHLLQEFVAGGGRLLLLPQAPEWLDEHVGFRTCHHVLRYVFPVTVEHPVTRGLESIDLGDWRGQSKVVEAYPEPGSYRVSPHGKPYYGWHWGNRGAVASAAVEKPHRTGWRPIIEAGFDLAYSPLMELDYGNGRVIYCGLDIVDAATQDPGARRLAGQLLEYAANAALMPRAARCIYVGSQGGRRLLDLLGVEYQKTTDTHNTDLCITDNPAKAGQAKRVFVLPRPAGGKDMTQVANFAGSLKVPGWPECRGLSPSDLRWRADHEAIVFSDAGEGEVGAEGLLRRTVNGEQVIIECQIDPFLFDCEKQPYYRYTRWRQTRAIAQILANLGASFEMDAAVFDFAGASGDRAGDERPGLYHPDYRDDFGLGDDPYRYFRW